MKFALCCVLFFCLGIVYAKAQIHSNEFGFQSDNDAYLLQGSDRYYTNGIYFYFRHALNTKDANNTKLMNKVLSFEFGQKLFNPESGNVMGADEVDRPFAGYLYVGSTLNFLYRNESNLKIGAQLGFVGSKSLGRQTQTNIHRWFNFYDLNGWDYQIRDGLQLNLSAEYNRLLARRSWIDVSLSSYANIGNGFTGAGLGPLLRLGNFNQLFNSVTTQSSAIKKLPTTPLHTQEFFVYYKPALNIVVFDATIQGSLFNKTYYPKQIVREKKPIVFSNQIGASLTTSRFIFDVGVIVNSRTVKRMVYSTHQWGTIMVMYRFL